MENSDSNSTTSGLVDSSLSPNWNAKTGGGGGVNIYYAFGLRFSVCISEHLCASLSNEGLGMGGGNQKIEIEMNMESNKVPNDESLPSTWIYLFSIWNRIEFVVLVQLAININFPRGLIQLLKSNRRPRLLIPLPHACNSCPLWPVPGHSVD